MDTLNDTDWDVVIAGTGLPESLLALALSRSKKKVLHVDKNDYYGGAEAALSLQDAEDWVKKVETDAQDPQRSQHFSTASVVSSTSGSGKGLSFPRAYSLALAPQIIYAKSNILRSLVSARVDTQLEFLAVGSLFVCSQIGDNKETHDGAIAAQGHRTRPSVSLYRIPSSREDILADQALDRRAKQGLMKFLRFLGDFEETPETWSDFADKPFASFLVNKFNLSESVAIPIKALVMSGLPSTNIKTKYALDRIARHLRSIGIFGPGFGAVVPKWGGLAEVAQVGCRAGAVGGGVYVLGNGVEKASRSDSREGSISIVSSSLAMLFPPFSESGGPSPAVAIIAVPTSSLKAAQKQQDTSTISEFIYVMIHNSETGECPKGQCVLYASIQASSTLESTETPFELLQEAIEHLISALTSNESDKRSSTVEPDSESSSDANPDPNPDVNTTKEEIQILWALRYRQSSSTSQAKEESSTKLQTQKTEDRADILVFPPPSSDLVFDDRVLDVVKDAWMKISDSLNADGEKGEFLVFDERKGVGPDDDDDGGDDDEVENENE